jgi:hypothetical protein
VTQEPMTPRWAWVGIPALKACQAYDVRKGLRRQRACFSYADGSRSGWWNRGPTLNWASVSARLFHKKNDEQKRFLKKKKKLMNKNVRARRVPQADILHSVRPSLCRKGIPARNAEKDRSSFTSTGGTSGRDNSASFLSVGLSGSLSRLLPFAAPVQTRA